MMSPLSCANNNIIFGLAGNLFIARISSIKAGLSRDLGVIIRGVKVSQSVDRIWESFDGRRKGLVDAKVET